MKSPSSDRAAGANVITLLLKNLFDAFPRKRAATVLHDPQPPLLHERKKPKSIRLFAAVTLAGSGLLFLIEGIGLLIVQPLEQLGFNNELIRQLLPVSLDDIAVYYRYSHWLSYGKECFYILTAGSALMLFRYDDRGRRWLILACWGGIVIGGLEAMISLALWQSTQAIMRSVMTTYGESGTGLLFQAGTASILFGFLLWVIPSVFIMLFLRRSDVRYACVAPTMQEGPSENPSSQQRPPH